MANAFIYTRASEAFRRARVFGPQLQERPSWASDWRDLGPGRHRLGSKAAGGFAPGGEVPRQFCWPGRCPPKYRQSGFGLHLAFRASEGRVCKEALRVCGSSMGAGGRFCQVTDARVGKNDDPEGPQEIGGSDRGNALVMRPFHYSASIGTWQRGTSFYLRTMW